MRAAGGRLATAVRERRLTLGLSAERLARDADVSVDTVRRIERGLIPNPGFFTVAALARVLGITLDDLAASAAYKEAP